MIKRLAIALLLVPLAIAGMQSTTKIEGVSADRYQPYASEMAYYNALITGNLQQVQIFLQQGKNSSNFAALPEVRAYRPWGMGAEITTPIQAVWSGRGSQANKLAIIDFLLSRGADANRAWRNNALFNAANGGEDALELVQWLVKHGAKDPEGNALAEAKMMADSDDAYPKEILQLIQSVQK